MTEKTVEEVGKWVAEELKLPEYTAAFTDNHIDGAHLTVLDKEDLEDMGIKSVGHRLKILQSIKSIKQVSAIADRNKVILRFTEHCEYGWYAVSSAVTRCVHGRANSVDTPHFQHTLRKKTNAHTSCCLDTTLSP